MYNLKSQTKEPLVHKTVLLRPKGKKDDRVMTKMTIVMMIIIMMQEIQKNHLGHDAVQA